MTDRTNHSDDFDARADALFRDLARENDDLLVALSPADIRRRGDRRRTRRRTGMAAGALGIGLLATASALSLTSGARNGQQSIDPAGSPTPAASRVQLPTSRPSASSTSQAPTNSPSATSNQPTASSSSVPASTAIPTATATATTTTTVTTTATPAVTPSNGPSTGDQTPASAASSLPASAVAPGWNNVPTAGELSRKNQGALTQDVEAKELAQEPFSLCQGDIGDLRYRDILVRHYVSGDRSVNAYAVVFGFETPEQAVAARKLIRTDWYPGCAARLVAAGKAGATQTKAYTIPLSGKAAQVMDPVDGASFRQVAYPVSGSDTSVFEEATIIQAGSRLEWVVYNVRGADNNWDTAPGGPVGAVYPGIEHAQSWADKLLP